MPKPAPRAWQREALEIWANAGHRGIISVVTGGGKTTFALSCIDRLRPQTTLVVVPTSALLDQWWEEAASYFELGIDEINVLTGSKKRIREGTVNVAVLNTAATLAGRHDVPPTFLIVDECHKAASEHFRSVLTLPKLGALGLSATPERPYDEGLRDVLVPALGDVIYRYDYAAALANHIIVPFHLRNVVFALEEDCQKEYDKLSGAIARSINRTGADSPETVVLYLKRARIMNLSPTRVRLALKLVASNPQKKIIVFHEDIAACEIIHEVLISNGVESAIYHSKVPIRSRVQMLQSYRSGRLRVLVTCRALDEGFNVPETDMGIIAASTATRRQRIQRLGRVVRPAAGKDSAIIYTLVATAPEIARLKQEEADLEGVAEVQWSRA